MHMSPRVLIVLSLVVSVLCLGIGVLIGYFVRPTIDSRLPEKDRRACEIGHGSFIPQVQSYLDHCKTVACASETCDMPTPRRYVAYHLHDEEITIDGVLDEPAWMDTEWTEKFVDIRGENYPTPYFNTRAKIRWDDEKMYVGAYLEEEDFWANMTEHDSAVFKDNAFEVFVDTERSFHKYKEIEINALETVWDLMMSKAYIDGGEAMSGWESKIDKAVYTDGPVNDPKTKGKFWSVEMAFPFNELISGTGLENNPPNDMEVWFLNFARSQYEVEVVNDKYRIVPNTAARWWTWNPTGAVSIHLPNKWGMVQFRKDDAQSSDYSFQTPEWWKVYQTLMDVFEAEHKFRALNGMFTTDIDALDLPPYVLTEQCMKRPEIILQRGFIATVRTLDETMEPINIRSDRYVWYGSVDKHHNLY